MRSSTAIPDNPKFTGSALPNQHRVLEHRRFVPTVLAFVLILLTSPLLARAQDAPEVNSTPNVSQPMNPRAYSQRRGMPPSVVRPQPVAQQPVTPTPDPAATPVPTAAPVVPASDEVAAPASAEADSMLQLPAHRAQIRVSNGMLSVQAENSNLSQVLHDIGSATGMKVEGLGRDERVFGHYGPAPPKDVLTALLDGAGYNVLMVGEIAEGTPKQLILSQRKGGASSAPAPDANATPPPEDEDAEPDPGQDQEGPAPAPEEMTQPPPGAPPNGTEGDGVRTPQQLLEQLQRMHQDQPPQVQQPPAPPD